MFSTLKKAPKNTCCLPKQITHNDEIQLIISHQITKKLGQDMYDMSHTLSRSILGGMKIEHRK